MTLPPCPRCQSRQFLDFDKTLNESRVCCPNGHTTGYLTKLGLVPILGARGKRTAQQMAMEARK